MLIIASSVSGWEWQRPVGLPRRLGCPSDSSLSRRSPQRRIRAGTVKNIKHPKKSGTGAIYHSQKKDKLLFYNLEDCNTCFSCIFRFLFTLSNLLLHSWSSSQVDWHHLIILRILGRWDLGKMHKTCWLVVSTPLKNINQLGIFFPIYGKIL